MTSIRMKSSSRFTPNGSSLFWRPRFTNRYQIAEARTVRLDRLYSQYDNLPLLSHYSAIEWCYFFPTLRLIQTDTLGVVFDIRRFQDVFALHRNRLTLLIKGGKNEHLCVVSVLGQNCGLSFTSSRRIIRTKIATLKMYSTIKCGTGCQPVTGKKHLGILLNLNPHSELNN